jgi:hypothetical protein
MAKKTKLTVGWREWVSLPGLGIEHIKAKIDTGARTSALHAFSVRTFKKQGKKMVRFRIHPYQRRKDIVVECVAPVLDRRWVTDSGGHREQRYVIESNVNLGEELWPIELTLTNRESMKFRMLLGRTAMKGRLIVNPGRSYIVGKKPDVQDN